MNMRFLDLRRVGALMAKEFIQMRRDRPTFGMMVGIPIFQLIIFGFAINTNPKALPIAVMSADQSVYSRSFVAALENSDYFRVAERPATQAQANRLLELGTVQFVVNIPEDFSREVMRGTRPALLVEVDATDPAATTNALAALQILSNRALDRDLDGTLEDLKATPPPFELIVHRRYNEEGITQYNIVPGLMGVVLTLTLVIMTSLAVTRETERGTMESLLATPVTPLEVMIGKLVPYILVGYVQVALIVAASRFVFDVPIVGSLALLGVVALVFVAANLAVGFTFSTLAKNQLQAMQMAVFFFLPSILLSGFLFPFRGMPLWAQWLGEILPITHFLRIVRGIVLKGNGAADIAAETGYIAIFLVAVSVIAMTRYRRTLD
ncbi:MAG: ABC transporter permease [Alphaproteobacteria bacterium]|nr:ABC transporter permease [Alphaproteobacteria bacterium]